MFSHLLEISFFKLCYEILNTFGALLIMVILYVLQHGMCISRKLLKNSTVITVTYITES